MKKKNDNVDIFIGAYKNFEPKVTDNAYKIVVGNHDIENNSNLELIKCGNKDDVLDDRFYSELYMLRWLNENYKLKKYVGFCHYRKYFDFMDDIPNLNETFKMTDAIVGMPISFSMPMKVHYAKAHNIEDLEIVGDIIKKKFPSYYDAYNLFLNGNMLVPYNMFIMKRHDFKKYCNFIFGVLDEYVKIVGTDINKRIEENKDKYLKAFSPNNSAEYQYRIGGYLGERLTNIFLMKNFKRMLIKKINITETVYNGKY